MKGTRVRICLRAIGRGLRCTTDTVRLIALLPALYRIYRSNAARIYHYGIESIPAELRKISLWHSNFLGLTDFWKDDRGFHVIFERAQEVDGNNVVRCFMLYQFLKLTDSIRGDVAEVGVYKGRTAKVLALASRERGKEVRLFDTFSGMPDTDPRRDNFYHKGAFSDTSLSQVETFLSDCDNVTMYPGFFPETSAPVSDKTFSFVHVDADIYRSVLDCCRFFYPRMARNGIMIFDDPGFSDCRGAKIAVDEFFSDKQETPCHLATAQVLVLKR